MDKGVWFEAFMSVPTSTFDHTIKSQQVNKRFLISPKILNPWLKGSWNWNHVWSKSPFSPLLETSELDSMTKETGTLSRSVYFHLLDNVAWKSVI